jgi:16S rRNA G527 N7-methylase RsmG
MKNTNLPDIEVVSAKVHEAWMESKRAQGITSRHSESGEELMVPYDQLSNQAQELDRGTVRAVYAAIKAADSRDEDR